MGSAFPRWLQRAAWPSWRARATPRGDSGRGAFNSVGASTAFPAAFVLLGLVVIVRQFARVHSYWCDEAYLLLNIFTRSYADLLGPLEMLQAAPPGYLFLLRALYVSLGPSEWAMRLPAFCAAILAILLFIPLARRVLGAPWSGWAIAVFAIVPAIMHHGCEVKPYSLDLCFSVLLSLFAARRLLKSEQDSPSFQRLWSAGFVLAAAAAPWFSFASVFVLAGAALSLAVEGAIRRSLREVGFASVIGLVGAASAFAVWWLAARHQGSQFLLDYWANYLFPRTFTFSGAAAWLLRCTDSACRYTFPDLGPLILLLIVVGGAATLRTRASLGVLLIGPLAFGLVASALGKYPMDGRMTFFAAPGLVLLTIASIRTLTTTRTPAWACSLLLVALFIPALVRGLPILHRPAKFAEFREAFGWLESQRNPSDAIWISHPDIYQIYYGTVVSGPFTPPEQFLDQVRSGRAWLVTSQFTSGNGEAYGRTDLLRRAGFQESLRQSFTHVDVILMELNASPRP